MRVGQGWDVHRLTAGRALILGGVTVPSSETAKDIVARLEAAAIGSPEPEAVIATPESETV